MRSRRFGSRIARIIERRAMGSRSSSDLRSMAARLIRLDGPAIGPGLFRLVDLPRLLMPGELREEAQDGNALSPELETHDRPNVSFLN